MGEPDRPQITVRHMRIACWVTKATDTPSYVIGLLLLLSVGLPVANAPDVLQPCGLLYYP